MKNQLLFFFAATLLSINCFSQISFERGYYINNANEKTDCLIKNIDWKNNPTNFDFKLSENSDTKVLTIKTIKEFGIYDFSRYVRREVDIDRSSEKINDLSFKKMPEFKTEKLFLKVLIEGESNLYEYRDGDLERYFFKDKDDKVKQLIFKSYKAEYDKVGKNNRFRQQLWNNLKCSDIQMDEVMNLNYKKRELVKLFTKYNNCKNNNSVNYEEKQAKDLFNLTIRPRLNNSSLTIQNIGVNKEVDFANKIGFGIGLEAEFILPFNKNKWAVTLEPTYLNFKSEKSINPATAFRGASNVTVDYSSIEMPLTIRHYMFLNNNSKFFINASYVFNFSLDSSVDFFRTNGFNVSSLETTGRSNLAFGAGYKYDNKYSVEFRYQPNREILGDYSFWQSKFNSLSIILGYTFL